MDYSDRIPTNLRTLLILEILGNSDSPMTATEINNELGLPKQTVHRLCNTLEKEGFLTRQGSSKRYLPARRLRDLGTGLLHHSRLHIARHQILKDVAQAVGETVNFVVPEAEGMRYLDRVETDWPFRIQLNVGTHVPFHCTASGKCFLASLSKRARGAMVASLELTRRTDATHTQPETLLEELAQISANGYALDRQELVQGMVAIAVPITDDQGRFLAALAVHGPLQRIDEDHAMAQKDILVRAANRLRSVLFVDHGLLGD
ncbi:MAG: IclR family transcriptional regulator [Pseudoprimorskyibacter sp.]|nr:IclR family transcriptional regulator [Pseudoprimorskyibacter sp.]